MTDSRAFGVLKLAELEIAVDAQALEQVINWPTRLQPHPLQGAALIGMFSLRGKALPLIDLRSLLGELGVAGGQPTDMVAIINHQDRRLGIAVSGVSDVMKIESRNLCDLSGEGAPVALLPELALLDDDRMIYLLNLEVLSSLPQVLTARPKEADHVAQVQDQSQTLHHLLVFECDEKRYAVDAKAITELVDRPEMEPSKFGIDYCLGVTNRRGVDVPALSINRVLGLESPAATERQDQLLVLTSREGYRIGLAYERMVAIVRKRASEILPLPTYGLREPALFAGVVGVENGEQALLLEHQALLERPETLSFAKIYQASPPGQEAAASRNGRLNQTCLVFQAAMQFVVPLDQVLEILDMPVRFARFAQRESHLLGSFNLRGEQIPLVCLSSLIEGTALPESNQARVLLVKGTLGSFGLVVNSTDSIESFTHPASEHPAGWEHGVNSSGSVNGRVRSLVSIGRGEQNRWMTLINLSSVVKTLEKARASSSEMTP
ncbi:MULTISPECIES: chemotaxis protein CheW [unclassified Pseudomonas]|uniref:chemotaxis protein CheW n=1 Tax=unclassified Pseudomonas TaxID=196821 RepID=UPI002AC90803|nr:MULTISPECIES: chemotaxis protein CheW [unclassified Pseudomonas]MEB0045114.1 chemotaxis protein CheW [Pseudomonas sp. Dout3]MEB0096532.1 chemotaxis protein CheW [Pseudomonas sp. DC1.2]WPX61482.1 chemotaxis protein CheW [Pseudomonas sp. DC1.2]